MNQFGQRQDEGTNPSSSPQGARRDGRDLDDWSWAWCKRERRTTMVNATSEVKHTHKIKKEGGENSEWRLVEGGGERGWISVWELSWPVRGTGRQTALLEVCYLPAAESRAAENGEGSAPRQHTHTHCWSARSLFFFWLFKKKERKKLDLCGLKVLGNTHVFQHT